MRQLEVLRDLAAELDSVAAARPELAARSARPGERTAEGHFPVVMLGDVDLPETAASEDTTERFPGRFGWTPSRNAAIGAADASE